MGHKSHRSRGLRHPAGATVLCLFVLAGLAATPALAQKQASVAGAQVCATCHDDLANQFGASVHSRLASFDLHGRPQGCEACHGPGAKHADSGEPKDIVSFKSARPADVERQCLACHADRAGLNWKHSDHALHGVTCVQCHKIHQSRAQGPADRTLLAERPVPASLRKALPPPRASLVKPESVLCLDCHKSVGSKMLLSSRHPVREGRMECSSCHAVHGSDTGSLKTSERRNDLCISCHTTKQGPFAFDHAPVSEDCGTCHVPHGSVNNNLLKQNEPFLCIQCHEAHFHIGRSGATTAVTTPSGGSQNPFGESGWRRAFGTRCTQCHTQIHGTNMPGQSVSGRGKSLMR